MSINIYQGGFSLFHLPFGVVSSTFQPVVACYGLLRVVPLFTSDGVAECKFTLNQVHVDFITKWDKLYSKLGQL